MKLFEPFNLGSMALKNRLVMPPMVTNYASAEGLVADRLRDYYEARARGGAGLVIVEATCIDAPLGRLSHRQLAIDNDRYIPGLQQLTRAVKKHGTKIAVQLHHAGRNTTTAIAGQQLVAPSAVASPGGELPRELAIRDIKEIIRRFAVAAGRARKAGFDGVEIHAAHGYLLCQFLSSAANQRRDEYGGSLQNRARMLLETIAAIKETVGSSYPVWCRINGEESGIEGGITIEEAQETARMCQAAGVAAIHVSGVYSSVRKYADKADHLPPAGLPQGYLLHLAEAVKKAVTIPVIAVGRITPALGEEAIGQGKTDLVAIGRGLIADPELPNKATEGRFEDINPCIMCVTCNSNIRSPDGSMQCRVNPAAGREGQSAVTKTDKPKRVAVVGGGPAGMQAAIIAARRGHRVTLFEKADMLGGQLPIAIVPPYKTELSVLNDYLIAQLDKTGVQIELGKEVKASDLISLRPDVVVVATGGIPFIPEIPGIDPAHVVTAEDVLSGKAKVGQKVVIIGGELVGCETAEFLADAGKKVTVTRRGPAMATGIVPGIRGPLLARLESKGVTLLTGVKYERITNKGLAITTGEGKKRILEADTIVLAAGVRPENGLYETLKGKVPEVYLIGDSLKPRSLLEALTEGYQTALKL